MGQKGLSNEDGLWLGVAPEKADLINVNIDSCLTKRGRLPRMNELEVIDYDLDLDLGFG